MSSQHPDDVLIRELIATRRAATAGEVATIVARMASAPFDGRFVAVLPEHQHLVYADYRLGWRVDSIRYHLARRIAIDGQWAKRTTTEQYLNDLRAAMLAAAARLTIYFRRGGFIAATLTATTLVIPQERLGVDFLPELLVVYSVDRGTLVTGYQCSSLATTAIPEEALWLK